MKLVEMWKNFNQSAKILLIVAALAVAASLYYSFTTESAMDKWRTGFDAWKDSAAVRLVQADSLKQLSDSSLAVADEANARAEVLTGEIVERDKRIDELEEETRISTEATDSTFDAMTGGQSESVVVAANPASAEAWIRLTFRLRETNSLILRRIVLFEVQVHDFEQRDEERLSTIIALRSSLTFQTARADSLEVTVKSIPDAPPTEKFLGLIPLPSRKTSLLVGIGLGLVAAFAVTGS